MPCMRKALCARSRQQQTRKDEDHMKKFLSLLLALTLVLSLVVVPARATTTPGQITGDISIKNGADSVTSAISLKKDDDAKKSVTLTADTDELVLKNSEGGDLTSGASKEYTWSTSSNAVTISYTNNSCTITANTSGIATVTCSVKMSKTDGDNTVEATKTATVTINSSDPEGDANTAFGNAITLTYGDRPCKVIDNTYTGYKFADGETWKATAGTGFTINENGVTTSENQITVTGTRTSDNKAVTVTFNTNVVNAAVTVTSDISEVLAGGKVKLTATPNFPTTGLSVKYDWFYGTDTKITPDANGYWNVPSDATAGTYAVKCTVTVGEKSVTSATAANITVATGEYTLSVLPSSVTIDRLNGTEGISAIFRVKNGEPVTDGVTYSFTSSNSSIATATQSSSALAKNTATVKLVRSGNTSITVSAVFKGKTYTQTVNVYGTLLEATLPSVQSGSSATYYNSDFISAAQTALNNRTGISSYYEAVQSVGAVTQISSNTYGYATTNTIGSTNGRLDFRAGASFGAAQYSATVRTRVGSTNTYNNYTITFNIPVSPAKVAYEDQYPEPVAYGNTYRYAVSVPSGYTYYYVVGSVNQTAEPTWSTSGTRYSSSNLYYLTDSNFVGGKCTLWLLTVDSRGAYSCGQLTVYQQNYNINYNGVVGETVQFAQSDFNDFMNKVAEARGDASKTKSYPYVTFDYVTFSLPTTAQGTLYYGGTAMSTSNSSGAFNTRTKVTNLDSVTFVPNAKTTAKTITLNFTLYATCYSSSSTSRGTERTYSGTVVVNLVREDIKYTVSQGDSVRFDESDFLSYLRSTKGYTSNYTIDYVTFDQSAVSAVNEGSLYTYYNGYNYGGSVKTTDKFYYNATASQNALSDVAFLASRYAKTGETVYIPFTIYARYGTTGTGTRQLTGTVAIKIGQTMNFIDVKTTDYFYNSVKWAVGKNITNGTSSTTFSPYKSCTRAEIVTFLWRAAGSPEPTITRNPFRDVNAVTHSSYYKAILWASQKGITSGTSTTAFSPDQVCTRAQIVTFLYRYAGQPSGYYSNPFKDVGATSEASYYKAILWAVGKGITTGTSATTFSPYASCNRAEAVTFLYRYTNGL